MGSPTEEGESPVHEKPEQPSVSRVPPDTWNPVGIRGDHPPSLNTTRWPIVKKYCEGKVKSTPDGEWKRTWNLVFTSTESSSKSDRVPFVEWSGEYMSVARLRAEGLEPKGNRVWIGRQSCWYMTRNRVIYPCPGWSCRKRQWRSERTSVEKGGDEVWIGEKFQSNPEIAGSPRNSFRASLDLVRRR